MQPLQSELVMRSINMLAEKYSHDRNRVELLQPYLGDTSCLSKVPYVLCGKLGKHVLCGKIKGQ